MYKLEQGPSRQPQVSHKGFVLFDSVFIDNTSYLGHHLREHKGPFRVNLEVFRYAWPLDRIIKEKDGEDIRLCCPDCAMTLTFDELKGMWFRLRTAALL